jgi:CRISPR-associated protein Csh1
MDIQYRERKATPFRVKLQGLKLDQKQVQSLLPEIQNKLEEYDKNYYRDLESLASNYFVKAGGRWKLLRDEIGFYFVLGMNLSPNLKSKMGEGE